MANQISIADVRAKYPQYESKSDDELAQALHKKFYSKMPYEEFSQSIGLSKPATWQEKAAGIGEVVDTVVSSMAAEPLAGLAGLATGFQGNVAEGLEKYGFDSAAEFVQPSRTPDEAVSQTREAVTMMPETDLGKEYMGNVSETLAPAGEFFQQAEQGIGDAVYDATGSPALAAAATTIPTLATEVLGIGIGKGAVKMTQHLKRQREAGMIARELDDALPTKEQLFETGSKLYKEIDQTGAAVKSRRYTDLVNRIEAEAMDSGLNKALTPKSMAVIREMRTINDVDVPLSQLDTFRKMAGAAAGDVTNNVDSSIGMIIRNQIDDLLDNAHSGTVKYMGDNPQELGKKMKMARDVWGRARKSEVIEEAFSKAELGASGFENGVRIQFRSILNNKKKAKLFTKDELGAMRAVVQGDSDANLAKLIGKFGFSDKGTTSALGGSVGVALGGAFGGPIAAVTIPLVGQVSKKLASRMTKDGALFADKVIRAGNDADKIIKAYHKFTPKAERSAEELSQLLMNKDIDFKTIKGDELIKEAAKLAARRKGAQTGAATGAAMLGEETTVSENQ